jgi:RHS repeat-associated protein
MREPPAKPSDAKPTATGGSGPVAPVPALPKGGGAIQGIGEKFSANPVTGTASLQIPLATSAGRGGFQPSLALSYDSGAGNGPFGLGWHLSIPQITRKTDKGLPRYNDAEESDVFLLSGAEDLAPTLKADQTRDAYVDSVAGEKVQRYRPRIEGSFARIERRERTSDGVVYWTATTPDNVTSVYGRSEGARIFDTKSPQRVFTWLLEETRDDKGNVFAYEYKAEDLVNVSHRACWEGNRIKGDASIVNRYLKRIRYGNTTAFEAPTAESPGLFEVVFDYGEHDELAPTVEDATIPWSCRQDPFSTYRAGFEIRTYRLCRRVLMFHRMAELGATPCLVRATKLTHIETATLTRLIAATQLGYIRDPATLAYTKKEFPAVEFGYALPEVQAGVQVYDKASLADVPGGVQGAYQWVDLDGEGLPGVLTQQAGALFYKQNLGGGQLAPARRLMTKPAMTQLGGGQQLTDLDGDGLKELTLFARPVAGYNDRTEEGGWAPFRPFASVPNVDWNDPNLRFIDLTGDGHDDLLITRGDTWTWYPSIAKRGFGPPITFRATRDEEKGPALVFADETMTIFLADMSGDGLTDLVRVKNGSVCYWPSLGYGRFGAKVQMGGAIGFDNPDQFDPRRIRLADIDGTGTIDVLYIHRDGVRIYANQAGNILAAPIQLPRFPDQSDLSSIGVVDLLGTGTACLVWSSPLPSQAPSPLRYVDLLGGQKPYLLTSYKNNLGLEVQLSYAPSTKFYRADAVAGKPWVTRLPFVVHTLERLESYDAVSRHRFVTTYAYHHGYFDGAEREFRGFGMVEQWDSESFSRFSGAGKLPPSANASDPELHLPPVRIKTWFHTGAWNAGARISAQYAREYYQGDTQATLLPDTLLPPGLSAVEMREACRALKGQVLRQEVYADDGTAQAQEPYTVSERSYAIRAIQAATKQAHAVFLVHPREAIESHYERNPRGAVDPRVTHAFTLAVDAYGVTTKSAAVGYPRRVAFAVHAEQQAGAITLSEVDVVHHVPEQAGWYRIGVPIETRSYELRGLAPVGDALLAFDAVLAAATSAVAIPYEAVPDGSSQKRLLAQSRTLYAKDDRTGPLPVGEVESLALPWQSFAKAFTPALLTSALGGRATDAILSEGGYVRFLPDDDAWWMPSGRAAFSGPATFYLPTAFFDPFGNTSSVAYDAYFLAVLQATDPVGNTVAADYDYRVLSPVLVTDANGNRVAARFNELGMVVATAMMGKVGDADGDTLADPTTTLDYDLTRFATTGEPNVVHSRARELHGPASTRWQDAYSYSDGSGHEVMKKIPAEPGLAPTRDSAGALVHDGGAALVFTAVAPRWVGTGRTVFDNKGNPVKQYEPFFSSTHEYEDETDLAEWGVTPVLRYDALGRLVRTDLPNGTFSKVVVDPWKQTTFDPNDNVAPIDPNDTTGESLWYQARKGLDLVTDPNGRAAALTHVHRGTPGVTHVDAFGRTFLTIEDNGTAGSYNTRLTLDVEGNSLVITDARQNEAMRHIFAMGGRALWQKSCDAGQRWMLGDVGGTPLRAWDERGHTKRATYDPARRETHAYVQQGTAAEQLVGRTLYGEGHPGAAALNLRGKAVQVYDGAGVVTSGAYDFKGNLLHGTRRLAVNYHAVPEWSAIAALTDVAAIATATEALLEVEVFTSATAYDALNRRTSITAPDSSEVRSTYNAAGLLEKVEARVRGAATWTTFVDDIDYDAKGQRAKIVYGNGTRTTYTYDPETFRLVRLKTVRDSDGSVLQNLVYAYDPVGNITEIKDSAQQTEFFDNAVVSPSTQYVYDALYRLTQANGREHAGVVADAQRDQNDAPLMNLPHANDVQALRNYVEKYVYDAVGNILTMSHQAGVGTWTRQYQIAMASNRLLGTSLPGDQAGHFSAMYEYDAHGSMTSMPHLPSMGWDHNDQMRQVGLGGGGTAHYTYDAAGQRVRKVWEHSGLVEERIYLGGWEVYRKRDSNGNVLLERETLHGMDGARRAVLVETKTVDVDAGGAFSVVSRSRFQLDNHLGSASLEVDDGGLEIGYEEYHPYGTTAYASGRGGMEVSGKRYRYTGKERDEETGLYYHGARHYAAWIGRWTSTDPAGMVDGSNLFAYVRANPVLLVDTTGRLGEILEFINDIAYPTGAIAKGITDNLEKRGKGVARAPGAIVQVLETHGLAGLLKAIGGGVHHLVKDTGEAAADITWEVGHYDGDKSREKIASRSLDVVLNVADVVTIVDGGMSIGKGLIGGGKALTGTIKGAASSLPRLSPLGAGGHAISMTVEAAAASVKLGSPAHSLGAQLSMMSAVGKGSVVRPPATPAGGAPPQAATPKPAGAPPLPPEPSDWQPLKWAAEGGAPAEETGFLRNSKTGQLISRTGIPGRWRSVQEVVAEMANDAVRKFKSAGVGAGATSGQHGAPYNAAATQLQSFLKQNSSGMMAEMKEALEAKIKQLRSDAKGSNHGVNNR